MIYTHIFIYRFVSLRPYSRDTGKGNASGIQGKGVGTRKTVRLSGGDMVSPIRTSQIYYDVDPV